MNISGVANLTRGKSRSDIAIWFCWFFAG